MMSRLYRLIDRYANRWSLLLWMLPATIFLICIDFVNLPLSVPRIREVSGTSCTMGKCILDTHLFYTASQAHAVLAELTPAGRLVYLRFLARVDSLFPLVYSITLAVLLLVVFRKAFPAGHALYKWSLLPLAVAAFDYMEDASIITMLHRYPESAGWVASAAGYFTLAKSVLLDLTLLLLLLGAARLLWIRARQQGKGQAKGNGSPDLRQERR